MRRVLRGLALVLLGCGAKPAPTEHAALGGDVVARVGSAPIRASLVADVASAQRIAVDVAVERLVGDALAAEGARAAGMDRSASNAWPLETTLARATVNRVAAEARAAGDPSDAELAEATDAHWRELDLPEQVKVVHVVVLRPKDASIADRARAIAAQLATLESSATSDADFESRAKRLAHDGVDVRFERLDAFVADGRTAEGPAGVFEAPFVAASFALQHPGDTSGVVESPSGWHVIRLVERRPSHVVSADERRKLVAPEVLARRTRASLDAVLASSRAAHVVAIEPDALELLGRATVTP